MCFVNGVQKTEIEITLRVLIAYCLLMKQKTPKLLEAGPFQCSEVMLVLSNVVSENCDSLLQCT